MDITDAEFEMLNSGSVDLRSGPWEVLIPDTGKLNDPRWPETDIEEKPFDPGRFRYLYAMPDATATVLVQAFLRGQGASFQTVYDEIGVPPCYVVFTDYASPCWVRDRND